jgi:hypothetical protein
MNARKNMALAILLACAPAAAAETILVPQYETDLQAVIDAAQPGDVIQLADATWYGPLHVPAGKHGLTLSGPASLVAGGPAGAQEPALLTIDAQQVTIRALSFEGGPQGPAIGILARAAHVRLIDIDAKQFAGDAVVLMGPQAQVQGATFQDIAGAAVTVATLGGDEPPVCTWGGPIINVILQGSGFGGWLTGSAGQAGTTTLAGNTMIDVAAAVRVIGEVEGPVVLDRNEVCVTCPVLVVDDWSAMLKVLVRGPQRGATWLLKSASGSTQSIYAREYGFMLQDADGEVMVKGEAVALPGSKPTGGALGVQQLDFGSFEFATDDDVPDTLMHGSASGTMPGQKRGSIVLYGYGQATAGAPLMGSAPKSELQATDLDAANGKLKGIKLGTQGLGLSGQPY